MNSLARTWRYFVSIGIFGSLLMLPLFSIKADSAYDEGTKNVLEYRLGQPMHSCIPRASPAQKGIASWYGGMFHGRTMANGKKYDMNLFTVAHRTLPLGTKVCITNPENGVSVKARVTDRGPYKHPRIVDLSRMVASKLGVIEQGLAVVEIRLIK